jgi:hypothetical protein
MRRGSGHGRSGYGADDADSGAGKISPGATPVGSDPTYAIRSHLHSEVL